MKLAPVMWLGAAAALALLLQSHAPGQTAKAPKDGPAEVNIVLRISRKLIAELTTKKIQRTDPVDLYVLDSEIHGEACTAATATIELDVSAKESAFVLQLQGTTTSVTLSEKSRVQVYGSGKMDFVVRKRVIFDGTKHRGNPTQLNAKFSTKIDSIVTPAGQIGNIIRYLATPEIKRLEPLVASAAFEDGKTKLTEEFDKEAAKLLEDLNKVSPLQETITTLYPETRDWIFYLSTTPTHLIIGVGPRDRRVPELPATDKTQAPIELWLRNKKETEAMLRVFKLWKDAGKTLDTLLPPPLDKSIKPGDSFKTQFAKEWIVIQLGMTATKTQPKKAENDPKKVVWRPSGNGSSALPTFDPAGPLVVTDQGGVSAAPEKTIWRPATMAPDVPPSAPVGNRSQIIVDWRAVPSAKGSPLPLDGVQQLPEIFPK